MRITWLKSDDDDDGNDKDDDNDRDDNDGDNADRDDDGTRNDDDDHDDGVMMRVLQSTSSQKAQDVDRSLNFSKEVWITHFSQQIPEIYYGEYINMS